MPIDFSELRQKAQDRIKRDLFADAKKQGGTNDMLVALGDEIAKACGSVLLTGPIKSEKSALRKLHDDYRGFVPEGDWHEMKDVVRVTIVAPNAGSLRKVGAMIRARFVASNAMGIIKDAETFGHSDPCGYSGLNFVVKLTNGRPGEIQANIPEVMYGKMTPLRFLQTFGMTENFRQKSRFQIEGGLGHGLYELYRTGKASVKGRHAALMSKTYYDYLRNGPDAKVRQVLKRELDLLVKANPVIFNPFRMD